MWFIDRIIEWLSSASNYCYSAYATVYSWVWPFNRLSTPLWYLYRTFYYLAYYTSSFNIWADAIAKELSEVFSITQIVVYLRTWLNMAENAWAWVQNSFSIVRTNVQTWWTTVRPTVHAWISVAQRWLQDQIDSLNAQFISLQQDIANLLSQLPSIDEILAWFANWWARIL
ncbi:unnamed protein product, partial [marine sediment metagenome]